MSAAAAAFSAVAAVMLGRYAFRLEPALAGGRFAPDLTGSQRRYTVIMIAVFGCAAGVTAAAVTPARPASVALVAAAAVTPALAFIDIRTLQLPLVISGLLAAAALCSFGADALVFGTWPRVWRALGAGLAIGLIALARWHFAQARLGLGDVALLAVMALYLGWHAWAFAWLGVLTAALVAFAVAVAHKVRHRSKGRLMPLGPSILAGWWIVEALAIWHLR